MEVPAYIRYRGLEAVEQYQRGYYHVTRVSNWAMVMSQTFPTGLSELPQGDERGQPRPGAEVLEWPERRLCYMDYDGFHEGIAII